MKIYRTSNQIIIAHQGICYAFTGGSWDQLINAPDLGESLQQIVQTQEALGDDHWLARQTLLAPIGSQEVWAAGVTYLRSRTARMEESQGSGASVFYDRVYEAERPELFFKANAHKVIGPQGQVRIRKDSRWNVPEPELTLVINARGGIVGYTIGNDMSSRSIEGENPLYLPQAKVYDGSAALGPCVLVLPHPIDASTTIHMEIRRHQQLLFVGSTTISQMKRNAAELVDYLFRECSYTQGVYLMTGTCIVPGNDFTLQSSDHILIRIEGIGTLENTVE